MSEYLSMGDSGAEPGVTWNSTKIPGVCKPSDFSTLAKFKALQEQINRLAQVKGTPKIAVDGDLGAGTVSAYNKAMGTGLSSCSQLAGAVSAFTAQVRMAADSAGAPSRVSGPAPTTAPSIVTPAGSLVVAPPGAGNPMAASVYDAFGSLGGIGKIAALGIAGGIGYLLLKKKRRK